MGVNRVDFGGNTLIDLTGDTLESAEQLLNGIIAHARDGSVITGLMEAGGGGGDYAATLDSLIDRSITEISNDRVTSIGAYAFYRSSLATANFPSATSIAIYAFSICELTTVKFPAVMRINNFAFYYSSILTTADFPVATSIGIKAFYGCSALTALILRKTDAGCTLSSSDAFSSTPIASGTGYIYVPSALVDSYKAATNWSIYSDKIRAIEDYPDITGGAE